MLSHYYVSLVQRWIDGFGPKTYTSACGNRTLAP